MLALTLQHPWPFAILHLGKRIANRRWEPPAGLIGNWFAIHGAVIPTTRNARWEAFSLAASLVDRFVAEDAERMRMQTDIFRSMDLVFPTGIIAVAKLGRVVEHSADPWFEGPFGWVLSDLVAMPKPIPCRGAQKLWTLPRDVHERVRVAYREAKQCA